MFHKVKMLQSRSGFLAYSVDISHWITTGLNNT